MDLRKHLRFDKTLSTILLTTLFNLNKHYIPWVFLAPPLGRNECQ